MIVDNAFWDRALFLLIGMILGLFLGWTSRAMRYAKEARDNSRETLRKVDSLVAEKSKEKGTVSVNGVALFAVVLLTAGSAFMSGLTSVRVNDAQDALNETQGCTEKAIAAIIKTLNERTFFSSDIAKADTEQNKTFLRVIRLSAANQGKSNISPKEAKQILDDFGNKLNHYLDLINREEQLRRGNPYPTVNDYRNCLKEAKGK